MNAVLLPIGFIVLTLIGVPVFLLIGSGALLAFQSAGMDSSLIMAELYRLGQDAPALMPDLIEPWTLISRDGELGTTAEIRIHAKARFGYGAGLRLQIMMLVEGQLSAAAIPLA